MKHIMLSIASAVLLTPSLVYAITPQVQPEIVIKRAIVVNGSTDATTFDGPTQSTVVVGQSGASNISGFESAMQFEFLVEGHPVNVTGFKATVGKFVRVHNGAQDQNTPFGAYHPIDQGSPDYLVYDASGASVMPTGTNKFVAGLSDNSGTLIPVLSKFKIVNHTNSVTLSDPGEYYSLWYEMTFSYTYDNVLYTKTFLNTETEVMILVTDDLPGFQNTSNLPSQIMLQVSDDLVNWVPSPVPVPYPRPTVVLNIINLVPSTTNVDGLDDDNRRFYRYKQQTFTSFP